MENEHIFIVAFRKSTTEYNNKKIKGLEHERTNKLK